MRKCSKMIVLSMMVFMLGMTGCVKEAKETIETTSVEKNKIINSFEANDFGRLCDYYQTYDGKWHVKNLEGGSDIGYDYRLVLTGTMSGAEGESHYVVLSNDKNISFEMVTQSIISSSLNARFDIKTAIVVEMY